MAVICTEVYFCRWPVCRREFLRRRNFPISSFGPFTSGVTTVASTRAPEMAGLPTAPGAAGVGQQHLLETNGAARLDPFTVIDQQGVPLLNPMLTIAVGNHCEHGVGPSSSPGKTNVRTHLPGEFRIVAASGATASGRLNVA